MKPGFDMFKLHHFILRRMVDKGYPPSITAMTHKFRRMREDVIQELRGLQGYHGIVLHPRSHEVWAIHPFSAMPTNFLVQQGKREWWSNCAWCSLGAAELLGGDVTITTTLGANGRQVQVRVVEGELLDSAYCVHFPIPMVNAWDNVIFTCSTMLLFDRPDEVQTWCKRHHMPRGDIQPIAKVHELAKTWYGRHLDPDWKKWTLEEAKAIFDNLGLTHSVWHIPETDARF